jgi:tetratricopeptide (TPR) repeat protein
MQCRPHLCLCLLLGLSCGAWAQQNPAPPSTPPSSPAPSSNRDASGLSHDLSFPEDEPAQPAPTNDAAKKKAPSLAPPRSDSVQVDDLAPGVGDSSSKDGQVDLSAPADDAKAHPQSSTALADAEAAASGSGGVAEFHAWDPHKAAKNIEVGDFYFKRQNYRAAEDRYREALHYKDNDAVATIRLAECLEKLGISDDARSEFESYLRILPHGPQASEAKKAIERLKAQTTGPK